MLIMHFYNGIDLKFSSDIDKPIDILTNVISLDNKGNSCTNKTLFDTIIKKDTKIIKGGNKHSYNLLLFIFIVILIIVTVYVCTQTLFNNKNRYNNT